MSLGRKKEEEEEVKEVPEIEPTPYREVVITTALLNDKLNYLITAINKIAEESGIDLSK